LGRQWQLLPLRWLQGEAAALALVRVLPPARAGVLDSAPPLASLVRRRQPLRRRVLLAPHRRS
jgi:hypothetical protein